MVVKELIQEWRIWFLITALVGAFIAIGPHYEQVEVDGQTKTVLATNINQGLDLQGGARVLIRPQLQDTDAGREAEIISQIITTLKTRIQAFGLQDMTIRSVDSFKGDKFIQIELAGSNTSQLKQLISRQGKFEAGMSIRVSDGGTLTFGNTDFPVESGDDQIIVDGESYSQNQTFTLTAGNHDIPVRYVNKTGESYRLIAQAFTGADITGVDIDPTRSGVRSEGGQFSYQFQVSVTREAAERFKAVAQNFNVAGGSLAGTNLILTLDNNVVDSLSVAEAFKNRVITTPSITGGGESRQEALDSMNRMKSILQSGALPVPIEVVSTDQVSPTLGQEFMRVALLAIGAAVIAVSIIIFIRYQNPRIAIPIMITGFSEVFILLGMFSNTPVTPLTVGAVVLPALIGVSAGLKKGELSSLMLPLGAVFIIGLMKFSPSLDLAAIAGIIAAVGTGVDDQIIITDERAEQRVKSLAERLKRAFFIIFTSAASTIGAMIPVMTIGAGAVRGFALTTIIGVLVGITITRPAYAKILEHVE